MEEREKNEVNEPLGQYEPPLTFEKVWQMFQETDRILKENALQMKETDRQMKETDRQMKETDRKWKESDKRWEEDKKQFKELRELFTSQWGRLVESLVEGDLIKLLNERNIKVTDIIQRHKGSRNGENYEFDIIAHNGFEVVIVEVKTTLRPKDVKKFMDKMNKTRTWLPIYKSFEMYGAMAYLRADAGAETMAQKMGLFVIKATGSSASIINSDEFEARKW